MPTNLNTVRRLGNASATAPIADISIKARKGSYTLLPIFFGPGFGRLMEKET